MKKFLQDLETELKKYDLSDEEIADIISDHEEMIETAINEGLSDSELEDKFGNPKDVAEELSQFTDKKQKGRERNAMETKEFSNISEGYGVLLTLINEDTDFQTTEENKIIVEYSGKRPFSDYTITFENNQLVVKAPKGIFEKNTFFGFGKDSNHFTITLPKGVKISDFSIKQVNGDMSLKDVEAELLLLDTKNGDLELSNLQLTTFKMNTINGDVNIQNVVAKTLAVSQISGDLKIKKTTIIGDFDAHTVSGDIRLDDVNCDNFTLRTVSGDVKGDEFYPSSVSLSSVSGDVVIKNNDSSRPIEIKSKRALSGDIVIKVKK